MLVATELRRLAALMTIQPNYSGLPRDPPKIELPPQQKVMSPDVMTKE